MSEQRRHPGRAGCGGSAATPKLAGTIPRRGRMRLGGSETPARPALHHPRGLGADAVCRLAPTQAWAASLWSELYPWALLDRVIGMGYWVVPILLAVGAMWLLRKSAILRKSPGGPARRLPGLALLAVTVGVIVAGEFLSLTFECGVVITQAIHGKVTSADLTVLSEMKDMLPSGSIVLTDGEDDGVIWVGALTPQVAFMTKGWINDHPDDSHFVAVQNACSDPAAASRALLDVDAVFLRSKHIITANHPWKLDCVSRIPGLRLLAQATRGGKTAAVFAVDRNSARVATILAS